MQLTESAHTDTFCRDNLPNAELWPEFSFDLPELQYPDRLNCAGALLDDVIAEHGADRPCVSSLTESWTYGELLTRSNQVANVLTDDLGLQPGNRVLLRGANSPWLVACWFGVIKAGGVVVTTMSMLRTPELTKLISLTQPVIGLTEAGIAGELESTNAPIAIVKWGGDGDDDLTTRCAAKSGRFTNVDTAADDVVLLAPTSGTTGVPKATMHFHRDVLANADTFSRHVLQPQADDVFVGTPPLAFTFGLGGLVVFPMRVGASTVLIERATPGELATIVSDTGATIVFTAPTAYRAMVREGTADLLRGVRKCVSAGESLPASTSNEFYDATGIRIIDGIGATEMLHVFISASGDDIRPGSTGKPVPGYRCAILDLDGREVPDGTAGQLAVKGPTGCRYLADDRQRAYVQGGWNITGDVYIRDADGYYWYQARSDDMIVSSGYNIGAPEVEFALYAHPEVVECAVVGKPDSERGQLVHAAIVLSDGVTGDDAKKRELQDFVKTVIAPYKYPRSIEFLDALPRTESGKLQRFRLRDDAR